MDSRFYFLIIFIFSFFLFNCTGNAQTEKMGIVASNNKIEVLDFHTDHRCKTCLTIENLTKTILQNDYATELEKGIITFQLINADKKENFKIAEKFGAFGTSLVINVIHNGEESFVDITQFAFMNADNEIKFTEGFQKQLNTELKKLKQ